MKQFRYLQLIGSFLALNFISNAQPLKVTAVSDISRIYEDGYRMPYQADTIKLFGIRGEIISGQAAIYAVKKLTGVTVETGAFENGTSGKKLPADNIGWNFVGSVLLPENAPNQPADVVERKAPARFPDYLMQERNVNIEKGKFLPLWLTVKIPLSAGDGVYDGNITVTSNEGSKSIPLQLTVYPLTLPDERHIKIAVRFGLGKFDKYHGIRDQYSDSWFAMVKKYADNMAEHRQNVIQAPMNAIEISKSADGSLNFDFTRFDQIVQVFMNTGKMDFIETGYGLTKFGSGDWFSTQILLSDFQVKAAGTGTMVTLPGDQVVPVLLPAFERHLRQKGWLEKTLLSVRNEPSVHNFQDYDALCDYFHRLAPDLKQFESIETTMYGSLDLPGPKLDHLATWYDNFREDQEKGKEVGYYIVGIYQGSRFPDKTIDVPLMDSRIMPWLNYKYDLGAIKHWGWNSWTDDPFNTVGQHLGDGWHVYPVRGDILNSLRWEEMRNGIQDYECFRLLEDRVKSLKDSLGSSFSWIEPRQRGVEIAGQMVKSFSERSNDPALLYNAKRMLLGEIIDFGKSPRVYVQTNPRAGTELTPGSTIEVFGWAEPGSKVTVNRSSLPVTEEGLFLEQFSVNARSNRIRVTVEKDGLTKIITREFRINQ